MDQQCRRCLILKPLHEFYKEQRGTNGHRQTCKACTRYRMRSARYRKKYGPNKPYPLPNHMVRAIAYYKRLQDKFFKTSVNVAIPIRVPNVLLPVPNACVMKRVGDQNVLFISSLHGSREYPLEMVGPNQFLEIISELGFELVVPERIPNGET